MIETSSLVREVTDMHADLCAALADPRRILILYAISTKPQSVTDIAAYLAISQPATSRHLKTLRDSGLVLPVRHGTSVVYHLIDPRLIEALDILRLVLKDRLLYRAGLLEMEGEASI
jgi:ArsR family transcriptional regulator